MTLRKKDPLFPLLIALFLAATAWAFSLSAHAAGPPESAAKGQEDSALQYEIKNGDTLGEIAIEHGVELDELMEINEIDDPDKVYAGRKLVLPAVSTYGKLTKRGVLLEVPEGFSISRIAAAYEVSVNALIRANRLDDPDRIRVGQKLLVPGAKKIVELVPPPPCFKDAVTLYRVRTDDTRRVPLCFCDGRPNPKAVETLSAISGPKGTEVPFPLHPRIVALLQRIAERFPGRRIEIISGQRVPRQAGNESFHNKGRALDFRVEGISNKALVSFVRSFKNVGVGYYPNSVFIHMDARDKDAYWIDYSRPGEKAIYGRAGMSQEQLQKIRERRQASKTEKAVEEIRSAVDRITASLEDKTDEKS